MSIVDWIFPKMCIGCGREDGYICGECQKQLIKPEPTCPMCCKPSIDGWTHPRCRAVDGIDRLIVGLTYKGLVQNCLKKVKYKSDWDIVGGLYALCNFEGIENCVVTSVPMWRAKERERGFNQAEILAEHVVKSLPGVSRKVDMLERVRETKPMFGLTRKARSENIADAFRIINNQISIIKQQKVILVDDVWTTGSTMRECAKMLKQSGVREIWALALAR